MITGECFCGAIRYEIDGPLINAKACHCSRCRKAFSGSSSAFAELSEPDRFRWVAGEVNLKQYLSKQGWELGFCSLCGSTLCGLYRGAVKGVTLGSVNGDPGIEISAHIFVGSKAPWDHIGGSALAPRMRRVLTQWFECCDINLTMDDELTLLSAREDPVGMIRSLDRAVIDEIQRAPQLLLTIKKSVDEDRRPGRFLLTGSANLMALPTVADSLAGRMETLSLLPLSQSEIESRSANWIDNAFTGRIIKVDQPALGGDLIERVLRGGYPEAISRASAKRRVAWARHYIDAIVQRDVRRSRPLATVHLALLACGDAFASPGWVGKADLQCG